VVLDMGAPLSPSYVEGPYWWAGVDLPSSPEHPLPRTADVVVVGGGYTGLSAADELARRGRSVTVLEAGSLGIGASSRNGGMVHPGLKHGVVELRAQYGDRGRALYDVTVDAFDALEKLIADEGIDCNYVRSGHVYLAHREGRVAQLHAAAREYRDELGEAAHVVPREQLREEIGSQVHFAGLVVEKSGGLHPAKYFAGIAARTLRSGADVHEHTPADRIERTGSGFHVLTARGRIACGDVLVATNGYTGGLVPWLRRRILPIGSYIIATRPLPDELAREISPKGRMFFDTKNFLYYWRLSPDNRVLFGGRTSFAPTTVPRSREFLYRALTTVHPQLDGVALDFAWGGNVALTVDRMPHFGKVDGITYAMGYCGTGVSLSAWFGRLAAAWLSGDDPNAFEALTWRQVPPPAQVPWLLPVGGWYYRLRDRLG
jgi:glycine/D-amino acid oxidase-like deaminating enzyme